MVLRLLIGTVLFYGLSVAAQIDLTDQFIQRIEKKFSTQAAKRVATWRDLMIVKTPQTEREILTRVNDFFNQRTRFVNDSKLWNVKDYWATPLEFLVKGAGDCEDYAIAKYFTLKALGVDDKKMRLTYVKALKLNQAHMVLTYFETPRSVPLVLDNLVTAIKPALQRKDLLPVYSFNGTGLWLAKAQGRGKKVGQSSRVNLWRDLNLRMEKVSF
ncbi:MAG: transglutaminase-like cysteine peptidase [Methylococcales bacterium]